MAASNEVRLDVGGKRYGGWKSVSITASLEDAAREFTFPASETNPDDPIPIGARPGAECKVWIGDDLVVTGYIDGVDVSYDGESHELRFDGRSQTQDIVDCAAVDKYVWRRAKLEKIAADLCGSYGIDVVAQVDTGERIPKHKVEPGETVFECLERAAKMRGCMLVDDEQGRLVITRVDQAARATTALVQGGPEANIISCNARFSAEEVYSEYICRGQSAGDDDTWGREAAHVEANAEDDGIGRRRVLVITPESGVTRAEARERATWEAAHRAGKSIDVGYRVPEWRQGDGALWAPNMLVQVLDKKARLDGELLIYRVTYELSIDGGRVASLAVCPPARFDLYEPKRRTKKARRASGLWSELNPT